MSSYEQFQIGFEQESERVFNELIELTEEDLLQIINDRLEMKYGVWRGMDYYQIWRVFGIKGTQKSIQPLFDIVNNLNNDYLIRYHACAALFSIARIYDGDLKGKVQYGRDKNGDSVNQMEAIRELGLLLKIDLNNMVVISKKPWWKFWGK